MINADMHGDSNNETANGFENSGHSPRISIEEKRLKTLKADRGSGRWNWKGFSLTKIHYSRYFPFLRRREGRACARFMKVTRVIKRVEIRYVLREMG